LVFAAPEAPEPRGSLTVVRIPRSDGGLDLGAVLERLTVLEVNEMLVECGPRLAAAFVRADLVDELVLYMAPKLLGADAAPLMHLNGLEPPDALPAFEFRDVRRIGADLRLILTPKRSHACSPES
jgi:diaminohydroxyphosphoribosylaminopyrimidine deaminase/5-amino-6-(5-phosphoribosylamino)uracil reductase